MIRRVDRSEDGSIVFTVLIILVVTALTFTLVATAEHGLKSSKRSGDAANALQVADAGVNDAVKTITNYSGPTPLSFTGSLSGGDEYQVTAVRESGFLWHITSTGEDSSGVVRVVKADALALPVFSNAVFGNAGMSFGAGVAVDSFINGLTQANTCTQRGFVGSNSPGTIDLHVSGGGTGVRNCTHDMPGFTPAQGWVYDGCIGYAMNQPVPHFQHDNATDNNTCGVVRYETPSYPTDAVELPPTITGGTFTCNSSTPPINPGTYRYTGDVKLFDGCRTASSASMANPVKIYAEGAVTIGNGSGEFVNKPDAPPANCGGTVDANTSHNDFYSSDASPLWYYCRGQAAKLQVYAAGSGAINLGNHVTYWGTVYAPGRTVDGGPHSVVFGAVAGNSVNTSAQITVHYDESLSGITNGRFTIENWREVR